MSDSKADLVAQAAERLEMAVERLAQVAQQAKAAMTTAAPAPPEGVPKEKVAAIAERLDATIAKLRGALGEDALEPEEQE